MKQSMSVQEARRTLTEYKAELERIGHDKSGYLPYQISRLEDAIQDFEANHNKSTGE